MEKIKELRKIKGICQKDIAIMLNKSITCICDWERGRTEPNIQDLKKLADIFECSIDYLVERESEDGIIVIGDEKIIKNSSPADEIYNLLSDKNKFRFLTYGQGLLDGQKG